MWTPNRCWADRVIHPDWAQQAHTFPCNAKPAEHSSLGLCEKHHAEILGEQQ